MRTFVINLATAQARRSAMTRTLLGAGIDHEFFTAITPADNPAGLFAGVDRWTFLLETGRTQPGATELACYASHLVLWRKCVELNEPIIVLEDDIETTSDSGTVITRLPELLRTHGFIRLEPALPTPNYFAGRTPADVAPRIAAQAGPVKLLHPTYMCLGTGAYAIAPATAARLLAASRLFRCPVDNFLRRTWVHRQPLFYIEPVPFRLAAGSAESQISERNTGRPDSLIIRKLRRLPKRPYQRWARFASRRESARVRQLLLRKQN